LQGVRSTQSRNLDPADIDISNASNYRGSFYVTLSDRIKDLELERQTLNQQKSDPALRTRIRIIYPANIEPIPYKNHSRNAGYASILFGVLITLTIVVAREARSPLARDGWIIERLTGKPIISQISHRNTHEYTNISPKLADQMRSHLSKVARIDEASRTLLSYRRLELAIMQECQGDIILLINAGSGDQSAQVIKNFLNIYATDHMDDYLLIDCNLLEPVMKSVAGVDKDQVSFWEGAADFEDVCINRERMPDCAFDLIPPMEKLIGEKTRIFRRDNIQASIDRIPYNYKKIFIRGLSAAHFIENRALMAEATDVIIFVDAKRTHYFDLQLTLTHLDSDKIRGLVAFGT
jgi:hypothetical protein